MKVLLLGATGNLGSRIAPALLAHNHQVVLYVRSESKLRNLLPDTILSKVAIVTGNATDSAAVSDALVQNNCDAFINSAGVAAPLPFQTPRMQGIVNAVTAAGVEASQKLGRPLRCWFLGGFSSLDVPGMKGTPITSYLPVFIEHGLTDACLSAQPRENLEWSLLCPNVMKPASKAVTLLDKPGENPLTAAADAPPLWQPSYLNSIPVLGTYISLFGNALRYNTILEDCADFMAADLENKDREFVGHRVGVIEAGKAKNVTINTSDSIIIVISRDSIIVISWITHPAVAMRSTQPWVATLATAFFMLLIRTDAIIVKRQSQGNEPLDVQASGIGTVGKQHLQEFDFEFDTGSNATWVASYTLGFDAGYHFDGIPLNRTDSTAYVDGTSASGLVYLDDVTIAGLTARNLELIVADRMDKTDNLAQNDYANAFIGMRYAPRSGSDRNYTGFFETLVMQNVVKESEFGFYIGRPKICFWSRIVDSNPKIAPQTCLATQSFVLKKVVLSPKPTRPGKASELTLGGRDQSKYTGEIVTAPVIKQGHWTIKVDSISVGSHPITDFDGDEFIVDTGTTVIIVPERIASQLHANIPGAYSIGQQPAGTTWLSMWSYPCNTSEERMPSFRIANHSLAISKEDFGQYPEDAKDGDCISKIAGNDDIPLILGTPFLRTWYTVFQWGEPTEGSEVGNGTSVQFAKAVHVP